MSDVSSEGRLTSISRARSTELQMLTSRFPSQLCVSMSSSASSSSSVSAASERLLSSLGPQRNIVPGAQLRSIQATDPEQAKREGKLVPHQLCPDLFHFTVLKIINEIQQLKVQEFLCLKAEVAV